MRANCKSHIFYQPTHCVFLGYGRKIALLNGSNEGPLSTSSMEPLLLLPISLPRRGSVSLQMSLRNQLRAAILDGRLKPGVRLPSTRALSMAYGLARNTVIAAYD